MTDKQIEEECSERDIIEYNAYVNNLMPSADKLLKEVMAHIDSLIYKYQIQL